MSKEKLAGEFRQVAGIEPSSALEGGMGNERRRGQRDPPKTPAEVHANVLAIAKRQVENDRWVKTWRFVARSVYLFALVGAYLLYYLIEKISEVLSLPGIGF